MTATKAVAAAGPKRSTTQGTASAAEVAAAVAEVAMTIMIDVATMADHEGPRGPTTVMDADLMFDPLHEDVGAKEFNDGFLQIIGKWDMGSAS